MWPTVKLRKGVGDEAKSFERSLRKLTLEIFPEDKEEIVEFFDEWQQSFLRSSEIKKRLEIQQKRLREQLYSR